MNRPVLALLAAAALATGAWHLLASDAATDELATSESASTHASVSASRPRETERLRATSAPGERLGPAAHARAVANLHTATLDIPLTSHGYPGSDVLRVLRRHVRVRFESDAVARRFEQHAFDGIEELPADGILGVDLVRLMLESGFVTDDRNGTLYVKEMPGHER